MGQYFKINELTVLITQRMYFQRQTNLPRNLANERIMYFLYLLKFLCISCNF